MSAKRRDHKNRILRTGESQRKDGRYAYKYLDRNGQQQFVYSWKLEKTDRVPDGKKDGLSLREKELQIQMDMLAGIAPRGGEMTVLKLVQRYITQKTGVTHNTRAGYQTVISLLRKDSFGRLRIDRVKPSDARLWLIQLQRSGKSYSSIHSIRGVVRPAFQMAVDDDLLRKNPFDFQLASVVVNDSVTREAITRKQERAFLDFVKQDKHFSRYYDGIYILFKTGMRISEFVGLTISDIDLKRKTINIDHQLQRTRDMQYMILDTKTNAGTRVLPMSDDVAACFQRIIERRPTPKREPMVGGKVGFLYLDKNERPMVAMHWEKYFQHICQKYNNTYKLQMPKVTPHVCRHTYCSNMAKSGINPKTLQYLMGHSDISVTLNTYTHLKFEDAEAELRKLAVNL